MGDDDRLGALEDRIGWCFADRGLLGRALTHSSWCNENPGSEGDNQRLEFLGDAVLNLVIGQAIMERLPRAPEGDLSRLRARVVSEHTLARAAGEIGLGEHLRLGRGEERTGGRAKPSVLGDACEAVVGAAYLDGGLPAARAVCLRVFGAVITEVLAGDDAVGPDYKTRLQELVQSRGGPPPQYAVVGEQGPDHEKTFEVALSLESTEVGRGRGRSKREAEQDAARAALTALDAPRERP